MLNQSAGASAVSAAAGLSRQAVLRIREDPAGAERTLALSRQALAEALSEMIDEWSSQALACCLGIFGAMV